MRFNRVISKCMLFVMLFMIAMPPVLTFAENNGKYEAFIIDQDNYLSNGEEAVLLETMAKSTDMGNMGVFVLKPEDIRYTEEHTIFEAKQIYNKEHWGQNGTILVIDLSTHYIEIISFEDNVDKISNYKASIIADNVYTLASDRKYYEASYKAITQINSLLHGVQIPQSMRIISNVILSLILALILNFYILKFTSKAAKATKKSWVESANVSCHVQSLKPEYKSRAVEEYETGSITAIIKCDRIGDKLIHVLVFILRVLWFIASSIGSSGGSSRSGGSSSSGGSRSGGSGRSSSGGHRF